MGYLNRHRYKNIQDDCHHTVDEHNHTQDLHQHGGSSTFKDEYFVISLNLIKDKKE